MTDRELLKLAAKAAGYQHKWCADGLMIDAQCGFWNPLTDDGDALRLAAALDIDLIFGLCRNSPERTTAAYGCNSVHGPYGLDKLAATRRAIVRAAAQIQINKESK